MTKSQQIILEMAYDRYGWVEHVRDNYLRGALKEYTKKYIALELDLPDNWSNEVKKLLFQVTLYMDKKQIATKGDYDRNKMLKEAFREASLAQDKIVKAKHQMIKLYPTIWKKIQKLDLDCSALFPEMIKEFLPEYIKYLK
jgi:hypothetical protein